MNTQVTGLASDLPITNLDHLFSELELALDPVRHVRSRMVEPSGLERDELNSMAPILGLFLIHAQQLISAGRTMNIQGKAS